jgi:anti-sigma regulatory factor (Ser/Thr protein kinase)
LTQSPGSRSAAVPSPWLHTLRALRTLPATAADGTLEAVCRAALQVLDRADLPFAAIYTLHSGPATANLAASTAPGRTAGLDYRVLRNVLTTGAPTILDPAPPEWAAGDLPPSVAVAVPVYAGDDDVPATVLVAAVASDREVDDDFLTYLDLIADQIAAALTGSARSRATGRSDVLTLQRTILDPTPLPHGFAVRYSPAAEPRAVGGDWYDVISLGQGRIGIVVGDPVEHGMAAAALMGQLRSAARALLLRSPSPAQALSDLDNFARRIPDASCTTVFCAVIDVAASTVRYSSAGHPPPIVVDRTGSQLLDRAQSVPLASTEMVMSRPESEIALLPGATVVLYTDGLVERRGESLGVGIERASTTLNQCRHCHPDDMAERLMIDLAPASGFDDDIAMLLYRHPPASLQLRSPARPASLAVIRDHLRRWLPAAAIDDDAAQEVLLAVGEAAANAAEHAWKNTAGQVELTVTAQLTKAGLALSVADDGLWHQTSTRQQGRGNGIALMNALVDHVDITSTGQGTTVEMRKELDTS